MECLGGRGLAGSFDVCVCACACEGGRMAVGWFPLRPSARAQVLEREYVDVWYKSNDKDSFAMARRLITVANKRTNGLFADPIHGWGAIFGIALFGIATFRITFCLSHAPVRARVWNRLSSEMPPALSSLDPGCRAWCACVRACVRASVRVRVCVCLSVCASVRACVRACVCACVCVSVCVRGCVGACGCVWLSAYVCRWRGSCAAARAAQRWQSASRLRRS